MTRKPIDMKPKSSISSTSTPSILNLSTSLAIAIIDAFGFVDTTNLYIVTQVNNSINQQLPALFIQNVRSNKGANFKHEFKKKRFSRQKKTIPYLLLWTVSFFMPLFENLAFLFQMLGTKNFLTAYFLNVAKLWLFSNCLGFFFNFFFFFLEKVAYRLKKWFVMGIKSNFGFSPHLSTIFSATSTSSLKHKNVQFSCLQHIIVGWPFPPSTGLILL